MADPEGIVTETKEEDTVVLEISNEETDISVEATTSEPQVDLIVEAVDASPAAEEIVIPPEESVEEKERKEEARLYAATSIIDTIEGVSLHEEAHPQLERPEIKPSTRRKKTNQIKTFAQLEEEERQRQEEAKKPKDQVDQEWNDPLGLLEDSKTKRTVSMAAEAQNVHATFMQKAKERKEKEEAEKKAKEKTIDEDTVRRSSSRMSIGRSRPKSLKNKIEIAGADGEDKVQVNLEESPAKAGGFDVIMDKLKAQGCCTIS
jgi:hypothetical protein